MGDITNNNRQVSILVPDGQNYESVLPKTVASAVNTSTTGKTVQDHIDDSTIHNSTTEIGTMISTALEDYTPTSSLATVATSGSYNDLSNKPTIGSATITIQKNGTKVDDFSVNATSNKNVNISIPVNVSDLADASSYYTASQVDEAISTAVTSVYRYKGSVATYSALPTTGRVAGDVWNVEDTGANYAWTGSAWDKLSDDLTNYVTLNGTQTLKNKTIALSENTVTGLSTVATSGSYNDLSNKPTIGNAKLTIQKNSVKAGEFTANATTDETINITVPTKLSDLTDDLGDSPAHTHSQYQVSETAVTHTKNTAVGATNKGVYIASDGKATAMSYEVNKSVPSDAVFTDTTYSDMVGADGTTAGSSGLVPAPAATDNSKFLRGDGTWQTPTNTKNTAGSTDTSSKIFLVGATSQAASPQTYSHDTAFVDTNGRLNSAAPASDANDTTVATTKWVKDQSYALDNAVVKLTGNQTIAGTKTFSTTPIVGTKTSSDNSTSAASTAFVKSNLSNYVPTSRTVNSKALSSDITLDAGDVGALSSTTTINDLTTTAQQNALNSGITSSSVSQITTNKNDIATINGKIPNAASSTNQLADKDFVNSSISTNTATFDGSWDTYALIPTTAQGFIDAGFESPTNNNYLVVKEDETQDGGTWRYKYASDSTTYNKNNWKVEYEVNETPMTAAQLNAINSGITSSGVSQITTNKNSIGTLTSLTTTEKTNLVGAINELDSDKVDANSAITGATKCKITYDSKGLVTAGANLSAGDIPNLASSKITAMTSYTKASASAAIATSDSLNTAIGKLEYKADNAVVSNSAITGATKCKITYDSKGLVTAGADLAASDIPSLTLSKISDVTATATELNVLDGITATTTELNYTDGVTSNIQTQLNAKATDSDVVHIVGSETISGTKTFSSEVKMTAGGTSDISSGILCSFKTKRSQITDFITNNIYAGCNNSSNASTLPINFVKYGSISSQSPATTETIARVDLNGSIENFGSQPMISTWIKGYDVTTTPSTGFEVGHQFLDDDGTFVAGLRYGATTSGIKQLDLRFKKKDTNNVSMGIKEESDGTTKTFAPTPVTDTTASTEIDTVGARNTKLGNYVTLDTTQTISGAKTFSSPVTIGSSTLTYNSTTQALEFSFA